MTTMENEPKTSASVIIVGAGPVGMLTALRLGQAGIDTLVIEAHESLLETTRAVVYMPMVIPALRDLGMLDKVMEQAYLNTEGVAWRDIDGNVLARLPLSSSDPNEFGGVLMLGQWRMNAIIQKELKKYPSVQIRFGQKITSIESNDLSSPHATITVTNTNTDDTSSQTTTLTASYILGTDGANSKTRHLLSLPFDGTTYDSFRMIGIDTIYDFAAHRSFTGLNFIVHPTDWAVIAYTGQHENNIPHATATQTHSETPQWRVAYVEDPSLPSDPSSILSRAHAQMHKYVHRSSTSSTDKDDKFRILRAEPYTMHQRHSRQAIVSRIALAGDALHSNNPIGGLGLTGGILDAASYGNALVRVVRGGEPYEVLKRCAEDRLEVWKRCTDPISRANLLRLHAVNEGGEGEEAAVKSRGVMFGKLNDRDTGEKMGAQVRGMMQGMVGEDFKTGTERWIGVAS